LVAGLVVAVVAGSFALAQLTPDAPPGPTVETARPAPTTAVVQGEPMATALPLREWFSGPAAPIDDVLVVAGSVRWLRLASGRLTDEALARPDRGDLLLREARGGSVCLCWQPSGTESGDPTALQLVRVGADLRDRARSTVIALNGLDLAGRPNGATQVALEPSPDGRLVYLARAIRSATQWQVTLDVIDLDRAAIVDTLDLIPIPQSDRSEVSAVQPPTLRIAPDGRHALVMTAIERDTPGSSAARRHAWIIELDGPALGPITPADAIADPPLEDCAWIAFVEPEIIAEGCYRTSSTSPSFEIRRYDLGGQDLGSAAGVPTTPELYEPLLDVTNGVAYGWDPVVHALLATDLVRGDWRGSDQVATADRDDPAAVLIEAARPPPGLPTTWSYGRPATETSRERTLVGSPDGRLLFAIGIGSEPESSSGVWVFDAQTLQLLERWPALAAYSSLALLEDGRWLAAIGRPGLTATGGPADWGTSVTIHDTTTGRPILRIGDLLTDDRVTFPGPLPEAFAP
jgi:hypothetical protein